MDLIRYKPKQYHSISVSNARPIRHFDSSASQTESVHTAKLTCGKCSCLYNSKFNSYTTLKICFVLCLRCHDNFTSSLLEFY